MFKFCYYQADELCQYGKIKAGMGESELIAYTERAKEEFSRRAKVLTEKLEKPIFAGSATFRPIYHLTSSVGHELKMHVLSTPLPAPDFAPLMENKKITILAVADDDKLVGFRTADLLDYSQYDYEDEERPSERGHEIKASGEAATLERNKGVGSAMELLYLFLLQQEANERGVTVVHRVDPSNLRVVSAMSDGASTDEDLEVLRQKQLEAKRWGAIYSSSGTLGFKDYARKFEPQTGNTAVIPEDAQEVWLSRTTEDIDSRKVQAVQVVKVKAYDDASGFQDEQLSYFKSVLLPQLQPVAQYSNE